MAIPGIGMQVYIPKWAGVRELNIGDEWRAVWVKDDEIPEGAPVIYAYAVVMTDEKGYVSRPSGTPKWGVVEGTLGLDEDAKAWIRGAVREQAGGEGGRLELLGYFECKATSNNPDFPKGTATVRPIYLAIPKKMKDIGKDSDFERRRLPLNEFAKALRDRYPELNECITSAVDRYLMLRAKGEA